MVKQANPETGDVYDATANMILAIAADQTRLSYTECEAAVPKITRLLRERFPLQRDVQESHTDLQLRLLREACEAVSGTVTRAGGCPFCGCEWGAVHKQGCAMILVRAALAASGAADQPVCSEESCRICVACDGDIALARCHCGEWYCPMCDKVCPSDLEEDPSGPAEKADDAPAPNRTETADV